jgi:hypothetical protein
MSKRTRVQEAAQVKADVRNQFAKLDAAAAASPGLETLLRVYGGYEAAMKQVDAYFALLHPTPHFTVSTTSGGQSEQHADVV